MIQPPQDYVHKKTSDLLKHKYTVYKSRCHLKAAAAELFHRHKANQTLHAKGRHTATSWGLAGETPTRGSGSSCPHMHQGRGEWCPGVKHDPTYTPRSYTLLRVRVRGREMGLDPESPIISRHVLCRSRPRGPSSVAPAGSLVLLTKGDTWYLQCSRGHAGGNLHPVL